jgi:hypothetical protein
MRQLVAMGCNPNVVVGGIRAEKLISCGTSIYVNVQDGPIFGCKYWQMNCLYWRE